MTNLTYLWMDKMDLTGEIPEAFSSLKELTLFAMASNQLSGSIPAWLWQHQKLQYVHPPVRQWPHYGKLLICRV